MIYYEIIGKAKSSDKWGMNSIELPGTTVKLGNKELLNKEQNGNSEPFPVTDLPVSLINSEQIDISEQFCDDQKVT